MIQRSVCASVLRPAIVVAAAQFLPVASAAAAPDNTAATTRRPARITMCIAFGFPDLALPGQSWDFVKTHLDALEIHQVNVGPHGTLEQVGAVIAIANAARLPLEIEIPGCGPGKTDSTLPDDFGAASARQWLATRIDHVESRGGDIQLLHLDWQVHTLRNAIARTFPNETYEQHCERCAACVVDFIKTVQAKHPRIQFNILSNFPNWSWRGVPGNAGKWGEWYDIISRVVPACKAAGVPIRGITVDSPYGYMTRPAGDATGLERVLAIERWTREQGLEFTLIVNDEKGGRESAQLFYENTLKDLRLYQAAGGRADTYVVETWYKHPGPGEIVPEDQPHTMTYLTKDVIRYLKGPGEKLALEIKPATAAAAAGAAGAPTMYDATLRNDGAVACMAALRAVDSDVDSATPWTIAYELHGKDIGAAMRSAEGHVLTELLAPGQTATVRIAMTPPPNAAHGANREIQLEAFWNPQDPANAPRATAHLKATVAP